MMYKSQVQPSSAYNISSHSTNWLSYSKYSKLGAYSTVVVVGVIILHIVCSNTIVLAMYFIEPRIRKKQYWFIASLAVADLLLGLIIMPLSLTYEVMGVWLFGAVICEIWLAADVLLSTASIVNICAIGLDRYWGLSKPVSYGRRRTHCRVLLLIGLAWFVSFLIAFPPLVGWRPSREWGECKLSTNTAYILYSALGSFYLPLILICIFYIKIYLITRQRALKMKSSLWQQKEMIARTTNVNQDNETKEDDTEIENRFYCEYFLENRLYLAPHLTIWQPFINQHPSSRNGFVKNSKPAAATNSSALSTLRKTAFKKPKLGFSQAASLRKRYSGGSIKHIKKLTAAIIQENWIRDLKTKIELVKHEQALGVSSPAVAYQSYILVDNYVRSRLNDVRHRQKQSNMLLGIILLSFVICWGPFFCIYLLRAASVLVSDLVFNVCFFLGYANSGINPVLYGIFNSDFRRGFQRICSHLKRRQDSRIPTTLAELNQKR